MENDETQRGKWSGMDGYQGEERESGWGGGDRSVSVQDETPKQVSTSQTDRQNTLTMAAGLMGTFNTYSIAEDKECGAGHGFIF